MHTYVYKEVKMQNFIIVQHYDQSYYPQLKSLTDVLNLSILFMDKVRQLFWLF